MALPGACDHLDFILYVYYHNTAYTPYSTMCVLIVSFIRSLLSRFLGKCISQYLSEAVENGELKDEIIGDGFDYERWKSTFRRLKNVCLIPCTCV